MKRFIVLSLMTAAFAGTSGAQISGMRRSSEPVWFVSGSVGAFNGQGVNDGATGSVWDFGQRTSWQMRASIEKAIMNESSIGLAVTHVHVPFTYYGAPPTPGLTCPVTGCTTSRGVDCGQCSAHLDMESVSAMFHAGGGIGFHQVIEAALGASGYRNLTRDSDGAKLAPTGVNWDGTFTLGYGFGFGLSPQTEVTLIQDYGIAKHESTNLSNGASNTNTIRTIRLGIRYGFGSTRPGVRRR